MIELKNDSLVFSFSKVHPEARLSLDLMRTLRIPDDDSAHLLPPGLGQFPLRHVDDFGKSIPGGWVEHGGIVFPMYQSEAMWLSFSSNRIAERQASYPFAIKIATGKIDAVTGEPWRDSLHGEPQDYVVSPTQPWLDGYCVEKGIVRQFVAMPLGGGYTAEEQVTGEAEHGGLQIIAYPMKREVFEKRFPVVPVVYFDRHMHEEAEMCFSMPSAMPDAMEMGLAPGGQMRQEIYEDPFDISDWDMDHSSRCFIHITNSLVWRSITGEEPPRTPPTAREYTEAGFPWFDYYADGEAAVSGSSVLGGLKSVATLGQEKGDVPLPENASIDVGPVVTIRAGLKPNQVREAAF